MLETPLTTPIDEYWMAHCLQLATQAAGRTAPNPLVGSVVVQAGQLVGTGFHPQAGQPHAEVFALHQAGERAQGATLYVNLEPCNHYGKTPPCTEAIIKSGIARVVVGMVDPNPLVQGRGVTRLREVGIVVQTQVLENQCQRVNEAFSHFIATHKPFGIWKYAMTLDGKIATATGDSFWVSGEAARLEVQQLRNRVDGIIVGGQTLRRDNPRLTCRLPEGRNPRRIILSRQLELPRTAQVWDTTVAPTLVFTGPNHDPGMAQWLKHSGVNVHVLPELTPGLVMERLGQMGLLSVLWECGGTLAAAALNAGAIQKVWAFIAPKLLGGAQAITPLGGAGQPKMADALPLTGTTWRQVGQDVLVEGYITGEKAVENIDVS